MNKFKQFSLIISGFALGQGSMFLAQTWLVIQQRFELLAAVGIGLGVLSLIQWAADCGGVFLLPKQLTQENFRGKFWSFVIARLIFSILFVGSILIALKLIGVNQTIYEITLYGSPAALIWSFNLSGVLDSKQRNHLAGPLSGLCWVFASTPVLLMMESEYYGLTIGVAYSAGLLCTVLIQYYSLKSIDLNLHPTYVNAALVFDQLKKGCKFNGAYISAQAYGRTIPILVDKFIDSHTAGIYVYAKNIANTASQFVNFSRRVEFSSVVKLVSSNSLGIYSILEKQKLSFVIVSIFVFLSVLSLLIFHFYDKNNYFLISQVTLILIAILFLWTVSSALGQAMVALERTGFYALTVTSTLLMSIIFIFSTIDQLGLVGVYIGESAMFVVQVIVYILFFKKYLAQKSNEIA